MTTMRKLSNKAPEPRILNVGQVRTMANFIAALSIFGAMRVCVFAANTTSSHTSLASKQEAKAAQQIGEAVLNAPDLSAKMAILEPAFRATEIWRERLEDIIDQEQSVLAKLTFIQFYWKNSAGREAAFKGRSLDFARMHNSEFRLEGIAEILRAQVVSLEAFPIVTSPQERHNVYRIAFRLTNHSNEPVYYATEGDDFFAGCEVKRAGKWETPRFQRGGDMHCTTLGPKDSKTFISTIPLDAFPAEAIRFHKNIYKDKILRTPADYLYTREMRFEDFSKE